MNLNTEKFQALASDFAYDDYQNFFEKPGAQHFMTFTRGFFGGVFEMGAAGSKLTNAREGAFRQGNQTGRQLWGMALYAGAYSLEYVMYGLQEGAFGSNVGFYTGGAHQKVGVYSHKMLFYSLGLE